jgi:Flp pilus assembly protein TadG
MRLQSRNSDRGQTLVEFALILPVFVLVLVGIFDVGRAVYAFNTVNNAAREGARLAIVDQTVSDIQDRAAERAVSLGVQPGDVRVSFVNTSTGNACTQVGQPGVIACSAIVEVPFQYSAATPIIGNLIGPMEIAGQSTFVIEFNCVDGGGRDCPLGG